MTAMDAMQTRSVIALAKKLADDIELLPAKYDGQPFTGEVVGTQFGESQAIVYALAKCVQSLAGRVATLEDRLSL